jgi:ribosomal-protein-alanine N-acetyltransferase
VTNLDEALQHIKSIDAKIESSEGINWGLRSKGRYLMIGVAGFTELA